MVQRDKCRGMRGYSGNAAELISRYEAVPFSRKHEALIALIPPGCSRALDVGAGAGGDAGWLAERGCQVLAVEPCEEFRSHARRRYSSPRIEWVDDCLPHLHLARQRPPFDLIMISAVWMHLDAEERSLAMPLLASMLSPGGLLYISLRHGTAPEGRVMFEVPAAEVSATAEESGLHAILDLRRVSAQEANRAAGVTWSQLAFVRAGTEDFLMKEFSGAPAHANR